MSIKDKIKKYKEMQENEIQKKETLEEIVPTKKESLIGEKKKMFETKQFENHKDVEQVKKTIAPKDENFKEKLEDWKMIEEIEIDIKKKRNSTRKKKDK